MDRFERLEHNLAEAFELAQDNAWILHENVIEKIELLGEHRPKRR